MEKENMSVARPLLFNSPTVTGLSRRFSAGGKLQKCCIVQDFEETSKLGIVQMLNKIGSAKDLLTMQSKL